MRAVLLLGLHRLRTSLLGPAGIALVAWLLLAAVLLPVAAEAALSAADRAIYDLGLLGLRISGTAAAFALGATAVGPALRSGELDPWRAHGLRIEAWAVARLLGSLVPLGMALGLGVIALVGLASVLGAEVPPSLPAWLWLASVDLSVVFGIVALTSTAVRGAAGVLVGGVWLALGRVAGASSQAQTGWLLQWVAPDLSRLDAQAAVLGAAPPPDTLMATAYGGAWCLAALLATVAVAGLVSGR